MAPKGKTSKLDEKAKATRRKILVESTRLFAHYGYHHTTVSDIAKAIGMTQGAFFHHFPNKEALLHAVVERLARGFTIYRDAMSAQNPAGALESVMASMVDHYRSQPEATICLAVLATEFAGSGHPVLAEIRRAYDAFVHPFAEVLRSDLSIEDPTAAAIAFIGAVQGIGTQAMLREGDPGIEAMVGSFVDMLNLSRKAGTPS